MVITLTILIVGLALYGGLQPFLDPLVGVGLFIGGWSLYLAALFSWRKPPALEAIRLLVLALFTSVLLNLDIIQVSSVKVWLYGLALALLIVTTRWVTAEQLFKALIWAGWFWPIAWVLLKPDDNANIVAVWPMVFALVGLAAWQAGKMEWRYATAYFFFHAFFLLMILGSRGALLGLLAGLWVFYRTRPRSLMVYSLGSVVLLILLSLWRPVTAAYRLYYWQQALDVFLANPLFGVGPGGLKAHQLILEPGGGFQPYAHNFIVSTGAELGLLGLAGLAYAGWKIYSLRFALHVQPWQAAIVTALLAHSLVDEPLYWPGPLLLAALVAGTIQKGEA